MLERTGLFLVTLHNSQNCIVKGFEFLSSPDRIEAQRVVVDRLNQADGLIVIAWDQIAKIEVCDENMVQFMKDNLLRHIQIKELQSLLDHNNLLKAAIQSGIIKQESPPVNPERVVKLPNTR